MQPINVDAKNRPLCFVVPAAGQDNLQMLHHVYASQVIREGDVVFNVFPKHQAEIEAFEYPVPVEVVLDPAAFLRRLCDCQAVISSRLHGVILGLHSGVPTIAAWPTNKDNKIPDIMNNVMRLPDQFLLVSEALTREAVLSRVNAVRASYGDFGTHRRQAVYERLRSVHRRNRKAVHKLLSVLFDMDVPEPSYAGDRLRYGEFWRWKEGNWGGKVLQGMNHTEQHLVVVRGGSSEAKAMTERVDRAAPGEFKQDGRVVESEESVLEGARPEEEDGTTEPGGEVSGEKSTEAPRSVIGGRVPDHTGEEELVGNERAPHPVKSRTAQGMGRAGEQESYGVGMAELVRPRSPWQPLQGSGTSDRATLPRRHEMPGSGSSALTVAALFLIVALSLPRFSSLSEDTSHKQPADCSPSDSAENGCDTSVSDFIRLRRLCPSSGISRAVFFGVNYTLWVLLAVGFNVCSKTYLRETRNPVALLAIQGWVGIVVLVAINALAQRRFPSTASDAPPQSRPSSPGHDWAGRCGLRQAKSAHSNVWHAALLHCGNAVLTSWSVLVGGIAATHALKALEPVAAAGFSRWLLGSTLPPRRIGPLAVIVVGLGILMLPNKWPAWTGRWGIGGDTRIDRGEAAHAELELAVPAVITACACCTIALRNVLLKGTDSPPPPPLSLLVCSVVAAIIGSVVLLLPWQPLSWEWAGRSLLDVSGVNASLCFVGYNLASFNLLSQLSPVGHAVGNASKRVCLFAVGLMLGEDGPMSVRQVAGAFVAFIGLAGYNLAGVPSAPPPSS